MKDCEWIVIDRFEEAYAVCVDDGGAVCVLARADLPHEAAEGDALMFAQGVWCIDAQETQRRRALAAARARALRDDE